MKIRKVINRPIDISSEGVNVSGGVNAVVSANVNEEGATNHVVKRQRVRVVQTSKKKGKASSSELKEEQ